MDEHDRRQRPKQWANRRSFLPRSRCLSASGCQHAVFIHVPIFQCAREKNCNAEISYQYVIMMKMARSDPSLDTLLELDGQVLVIDEAGYWVKFVVHRVPSTADKPHGLDYTLTLHGPDGGAWSASIMLMEWQGRASGPPRTTAIGCGRSSRTTTRTLPR